MTLTISTIARHIRHLITVANTHSCALLFSTNKKTKIMSFSSPPKKLKQTLTRSLLGTQYVTIILLKLQLKLMKIML